MKKYIIALSCAALAFAGCKKAKSLADINVDFFYGERVEIPNLGLPQGPIPGGGIYIPLPGYAFATDAATHLAQYNTSPEKVISATLKSIGFKVFSPPGSNFDFLDTVRVYITANGQPTILAAYKYGVPKNVDTFSLDLTSANLKNYFIQDSIHVSLQGFVNAVPPANDSINVGSVFHLYANPLN